MNQSMSMQRAALYERFRLPYPRAAIEDLFECIGRPDVVADIGAGTGQLSRAFVGVASTVYAVEPEPAMRMIGREALSSCHTVTFVDGTAEQTTLETGIADLIIAGNAFHRFRYVAHAELRRVLRLGGWAALLHYRSIDRGFMDELFIRLRQIDTFAAKSRAAWQGTSVDTFLGAAPHLRKTYRQSATQDWDAFFGVACSGIESPERTENWFPQFEEAN